jgi:hypothetical protein
MSGAVHVIIPFLSQQPIGVAQLIVFPFKFFLSDLLMSHRSKQMLYLKGYKLDRQKIRSRFPKEGFEAETSYELSYYIPIITHIPETAYKYVGCGVESDGHLNLVLVLEDGYDRTALEGVVTTPDAFPKASLNVLTLGIWPSNE